MKKLALILGASALITGAAFASGTDSADMTVSATITAQGPDITITSGPWSGITALINRYVDATKEVTLSIAQSPLPTATYKITVTPSSTLTTKWAGLTTMRLTDGTNATNVALGTESAQNLVGYQTISAPAESPKVITLTATFPSDTGYTTNYPTVATTGAQQIGKITFTTTYNS